MRRRAATALVAASLAASGLALLAVLAPPASACTYQAPAAFSSLQWTAGDALVTNDGFAVGAFSLDNGSFRAVAASETLPDAAWAASPDGAWLVVGHGQPFGNPSMCPLPDGVTAAVNRTSGERVELLDGAAVAMAPSAGGLLLAHGASDGILQYAWGAWGAPREIGANAADHGFNTSRVDALAWSEAGQVVAAAHGDWPHPRIFLFDAATGALLHPDHPAVVLGEHERFRGMAFSPDGRHLAVTTRTADATHVRVFSLEPAVQEVAAHDLADAEHIYDIAWGAGGIATAGAELPPRHWEEPSTGVVRVFPNAPDLTEVRNATFQNVSLGAVAWSPGDERLAAGGDGRLYVLSGALETLEAFTLEDGDGSVAPPPDGADPKGPMPRGVPGAGAPMVVATVALAAWMRPVIRGRRV